MLSESERLGPSELGLLAAVGVTKVQLIHNIVAVLILILCCFSSSLVKNIRYLYVFSYWVSAPLCILFRLWCFRDLKWQSCPQGMR